MFRSMKSFSTRNIGAAFTGDSRNRSIQLPGVIKQLVIILVMLAALTALTHGLLVAFSPACSTDQASQQATAIAKGQIVEKVECLDDSSQSYELYLPSNYTPERKWPILYALDPGARGKIPVEHFKEAAEKYGWILAGSNKRSGGEEQWKK